VKADDQMRVLGIFNIICSMYDTAQLYLSESIGDPVSFFVPKEAKEMHLRKVCCSFSYYSVLSLMYKQPKESACRGYHVSHEVSCSGALGNLIQQRIFVVGLIPSIPIFQCNIFLFHRASSSILPSSPLLLDYPVSHFTA
jgi:hypothetical protein